MATKRKTSNGSGIRNRQAYDQAKQLYVDFGKEATEIHAMGVAAYKTILRWIEGDESNPEMPNWKKLRAAKTMSKVDQMTDIAAQIQEINASIKARPEGQRFANNKEADIIAKLTKAYNSLETDLGVREIVDVMTEFIPFVKKYSEDDANALKAMADKFIQQTIAKAR